MSLQGIGPDSVLEWEEGDDRTMIVRRAGRYSAEDIQRMLFGSKTPKPHTVDEMKEGMQRYARKALCARLTRMFWCG